MSYGEIKIDTITFTAGGVDTSIAVSGLVQNPTFTGNITTTGTITADVVKGTTTVSGATVTGTAGVFTVVTGGTAGFTTVTGTTVTGTNANFVTVSGTTVTGATGQFTNITGVNIVGTTLVSGATVTGNVGSFTTLTGGIVNLTSGVFASGTAAAPSVSIGTTDNGLYSPDTDQVAISTNGTGRLFVDSSGQVGIGASPTDALFVGGAAVNFNVRSTSSSASTSIKWGNDLDTKSTEMWVNGSAVSTFGGASAFNVYQGAAAPILVSTNGSERLRITSDGKLGLGTSSPEVKFDVVGSSVVSAFKSTNNNYVTQLQGNNATYKVYLGTTDANDFVIANESNNGTFTERMRIDSSGRVGVGTTSPGSILHLQQSASAAVGPDFRLTNNAGTASDKARISFFGGSSPTIRGALDFNINASGVGELIWSSGEASVTEKLRCDASGRLLVGTSTARTVDGFAAAIQVEGASAATGAIGAYRTSNDQYGAYLTFGKSRSTSLGGSAVVSSGDEIGILTFCGADGTDTNSIAARIGAYVDGTPGADDMPGRLVFSTTADGASSPTERMRIGENGMLRVTNDGSYTGVTYTAHGFRQTLANQSILNLVNANASTPYGIQINYTAASPNSTVSQFLYCSDSTTLRAEIRSDGGLANYSANNANLSDRNAKKDISPAADTWNCIKEWEIVNYRYKDQPDDADLNLGVIAQQVAESCPEVITVFEEAKDDQPEKLGVKEQQMYWMAIKALQEAQVRIEALEAEVATLKAS